MTFIIYSDNIVSLKDTCVTLQDSERGEKMSDLRLLRRTKDMTQRELAEIVGVSEKTIIRWEKGEQAPNICDAQRLANVLGCSITDLIPNPPLPPRRQRRKRTLGANAEVVL